MTAPHALPRPDRHARPGGGLPRLLRAMDLDAHLAAYGPPPYGGRQLIGVAAAAGLTGRGGAGFPAARKLTAVAEAGRRAVVVGNGAESEPASRKDKQLLWTAPHLVLDGLQLAAEAVDANRAYLYIHAQPGLHEQLGSALAARAAAGLDRTGVQLMTAPPRFLAGEESAVVSRINGRPALPRFKVPPVFRRGVAGAPTLVQNVETLAHLAQIARYGASWFRSAGTSAEPGTMLATCWRADGTVEVVETAIGTPLGELLRLGELPAQAVLVGGYHGTWLTSVHAAALPLANAGLRPAGAAVGAGLIAALPHGRCGVAEAVRVVRYLAVESAGQCGPCLNGLPRIAAGLAELAAPRPRPRLRADLERWAGLVERRGACHHPDGSVRFLRSTLAIFSTELTAHARGECSATSHQPFFPVPAGVPASQADWT
ncbi:MAG: NADH-ubiquinone oxidoreductase-F iron-sulfur binding region domain-containing protein [Streptosporangiaceae bacterium]